MHSHRGQTLGEPANPAAPQPPLPGIDEVDSKANSENFPVALRVLPKQRRADLAALYGWARLVDDVGDEYHGDRLGALDWLEHDLHRVLSGRAEHPVVKRLGAPVRAGRLDIADLVDLVVANRLDQRQPVYESFDQLLEYCRYSANPIGRSVLSIFGVGDVAATAASDDICSALQIIEHLQDLGEDRRAGRVYMPASDMADFGVDVGELDAPEASTSLRELIEFECGRARQLLESAPQLLSSITGFARLAITGFVAGGYAALDAIAAADHDVLGCVCTPKRRGVARNAVRVGLAR